MNTNFPGTISNSPRQRCVLLLLLLHNYFHVTMVSLTFAAHQNINVRLALAAFIIVVVQGTINIFPSSLQNLVFIKKFLSEDLYLAHWSWNCKHGDLIFPYLITPWKFFM